MSERSTSGVSTAATHTRDHRSILAAIEKRVLIQIAHRLPVWINSDHLSLLGLVSMAAAGACFAAMRITPWAAWGVVLSLVVNWFGDSLDGTVARVRNQQRPRYGFYVDHVIDIAGTSFLFVGMASSGFMHPVLAFALLAAYLLVAAEVYLSTHVSGVFRMAFFGVGPTELRILLAAGALKAASSPLISIGASEDVLLFDVGGAVALAGLVAVFVASAIRNTRALYQMEPLPRRTITGGRHTIEP